MLGQFSKPFPCALHPSHISIIIKPCDKKWNARRMVICVKIMRYFSWYNSFLLFYVRKLHFRSRFFISFPSYVKMSSPNINNALLVGCIMCYATVFIKPINVTSSSMCAVSTYYSELYQTSKNKRLMKSVY